MTRVVTRAHFHNSQLIRVLRDLGVIETTAPAGEFAEKLGHWVGFADAITLHGVHGASMADAPVKMTATALIPAVKPNDEFAKAQAKLEATIRTGFVLQAALFEDETTAFAPLRKLYATLQRELDGNVRKLRGKARASLAQSSPSLRQLATLDAAFEGILIEREKKLLASLPALLERRFKQLQAQDSQQPGWLTRFGQELQTVLLAELELRLQPTLGLLEALNPATPQHA